MGEAAPALPWVTIKYAQTLDGRIATRTGESKWISSPDSLKLAHELRAAHDAILVGVGTVLNDNPQLTVRLVPGPHPLRVVADSALRTPLDAALLSMPGQVLIGASAAADTARRSALEARGVPIVTVPVQEDGRISLQALLTALAARGVRSVLVEGGAGMITSLLRQRLAQRVIVCIAPKMLGLGLEAVGELGIVRLGDALTFRDGRFRLCGTDALFEGDLADAQPAAFGAPAVPRPAAAAEPRAFPAARP